MGELTITISHKIRTNYAIPNAHPIIQWSLEVQANNTDSISDFRPPHNHALAEGQSDRAV